MKKLISVMLILTVSVGMLCGCSGGETAEIPAYPLKASDIETQLEAQELDWTVEEETTDAENQASYTLYDEEGRKIAALDSQGDGESRYLNITFMSLLREEEKDCAVIETEDWVKAIACGTVLYGGFDDEYKVYKEFIKGGKKTGKIKTVERADMTEEADKVYEKIVKWTGKYDETVCVLKLGQPEKTEEAGLDKPAQELVSITFYNDEAYIM